MSSELIDISKYSRLTSKGYTIPKDKLTLEIEEDIKTELTIFHNQFLVIQVMCLVKMMDVFICLNIVIANIIYHAIMLSKNRNAGKNKIIDGLPINLNLMLNYVALSKNVITAWKESTTRCGGVGIVAIRPGGGKTVISIGLIADLGVETIILVHNSDLLNQWIERLEMFLLARIGKIKAKICNTRKGCCYRFHTVYFRPKKRW